MTPRILVVEDEFFIAQEIVRQHLRRAEIEAGQGDVLQIASRNPIALNGQIRIGKDLQLMATHVALHAIKIEIEVVGQVYRAGLINGGAILDGDTITVGQAVVRRSRQIAGEPLIAIVGGE